MDRPTAPASGRFVLRIPAGLHASLREAARAAGVSLNEYCARKLAAPLGALAEFGDASRVVERAADLCGDDLIGVVAHGSWARDELRDGSDVDVLVVVRPSKKIDRDLYRQWDEQPLEWEGRPVDAHFVTLTESDDQPGALWAEAALDGVVLFERGLSVSSRLARVRRDIADGRLVRQFSHGHPYWAEVA